MRALASDADGWLESDSDPDETDLDSDAEEFAELLPWEVLEVYKTEAMKRRNISLSGALVSPEMLQSDHA